MLSLLALAPPARADELADAGRRALARHAPAVITVSLLVHYEIRLGGNDRQLEQKTEAVGTVIDPGGLTVISLSAIDPSLVLRKRMGDQGPELEFDSAVREAKLLLADRTELPAEIVLRDRDLDIAFLLPVEKPARPLAAIDLQAGARPQLLDQVIGLNRLGPLTNRTVAVSLDRIAALVERPRPFYVLGASAVGIGAPVFALSGAPLGLLLLRATPGDPEANFAALLGGPGGKGILPVVVPAADILEDARQALEAKRPAKGGPPQQGAGGTGQGP